MDEETPFIDSVEFMYECLGCDGWVLSGSFCSTAAKIVERLKEEDR